MTETTQFVIIDLASFVGNHYFGIDCCVFSWALSPSSSLDFLVGNGGTDMKICAFRETIAVCVVEITHLGGGVTQVSLHRCPDVLVSAHRGLCMAVKQK